MGHNPPIHGIKDATRLGSIEGGTADRRENEIRSIQNENEKHLI